MSIGAVYGGAAAWRCSSPFPISRECHHSGLLSPCRVAGRGDDIHGSVTVRNQLMTR
jgi:hypothetical protein